MELTHLVLHDLLDPNSEGPGSDMLRSCGGETRQLIGAELKVTSAKAEKKSYLKVLDSAALR